MCPATGAHPVLPGSGVFIVERSGKTVTRHDLAGKVWIADFIFTNCGGTCPMMSEEMRKLQDVFRRRFAWFPLQSIPRGYSRGAREIRAEVRGR